MILIAHRGNLNGPVPERENRRDYIDEAIKAGFNAEVDLWLFNRSLYLGHDAPLYDVSIQWLMDRSDKLWIHCKNVACLNHLASSQLNYFWHETDCVTLTSLGFVWSLPGKQPIRRSIAVLPEIKGEDISQCMGVCSDIITQYK